MPHRYRLLRFDPATVSGPQVSAGFLEDLGGFRSSPLAELNIHQWMAALRHALSAGAKTILLQEAVRDPDFREEFDAFYSKQQKHVSNLCRRLHFFSLELNGLDDTQDGDAVLGFIDEAASVDGSYLGFVTLRPLRHAPVGASILTDRPSVLVTCKDSFPVHIAGREFSVMGTPYLQQDNAVGACAQVSIWVALRTLRKRLGNSAYSPAELTIAANKHIAINRVFPGRDGLTTTQMLEAIRSAGHDPLIVELRGLTPDETARKALEFSAPYLESGLPVIIGLNNPTGRHAVVSIGYLPPSLGEGLPSELMIHNDNSGCYQRLPATCSNANVYALSQTVALITPLPDGICMTAAEANRLAVAAFQFGASLLLALPPLADFVLKKVDPGPSPSYVLRVFLSTRHSFRRWASKATDIDQATKSIYRRSELPRFVWVIEIHKREIYQKGEFSTRSRLGEVVLDASADALHGDGLLFVRLSGLLVGEKCPDDGVLIIERANSTREILTIKAPASLGQVEPWL